MQALTEYMIERLLLRDRAGPSRGLPHFTPAFAASGCSCGITESADRGELTAAAASAVVPEGEDREMEKFKEVEGGKGGGGEEVVSPRRFSVPPGVKKVCTYR